MKKKKIKKWSKGARECVKFVGVADVARLIVGCSADHMSAMLCGRVATTKKTAENLAGHFGLSTEDFGQSAAKKAPARQFGQGAK